MTKTILVISTSADKLKDVPTGLWAEEVAAPYYLWTEKGFKVIISSVKGGEIPMDEASLNAPFLTKEVEKMLLDDTAVKSLEDSVCYKTVPISSIDAVFLPGGHGVCADFAIDPELGKYVSEAWAAGKIVSAVCHGPNGLVNAVDENGAPLVKGKKVTGFTDKEEYAVVKEDLVPFMLEQKLKELGGIFSCAPELWAAYAVRDGRLITGQNPGSSTKVAELVAEALS